MDTLHYTAIGGIIGILIISIVAGGMNLITPTTYLFVWTIGLSAIVIGTKPTK